MSRFHRVIFHPTRPDTSPHLAPTDRKRKGKHGGHVPPPWVTGADASPAHGPAAKSAPSAGRRPTAKKSVATPATAASRGARASGRKATS